METQTEQIFDREKMIFKRQHGMLKCVVCGKRLKRLPSKYFSSKFIDGIEHTIYLADNSGFSGIDNFNTHLKCIGKEVLKE